MLGEALSSFVVSVLFPRPREHLHLDDDNPELNDDVEVAPPSQLVPTSWWLGGLCAAVVLVVAIFSPMFDLQIWQILTAVALSCLVAILAVRALGQTDLNPVSGVGKLSQIVFAVVAPGQVVMNLVAGALAEVAHLSVGL